MLPWIENSEEYESLAVSLRAVQASFGVAKHYEEIASVLGLSTGLVAAPGEPIDAWPTYARDAALGAAAGLLGLRLRDLHPPDAARGLAGSQEFAQHFQDSYLPLIERALQSRQLALVWCGWPAPRERLWGVISEMRDGRLHGQTLWFDGGSLPLVGPALQVYVVEEHAAPPADSTHPARLFTHAIGVQQSFWAGSVTVQPGLLTGPSAYAAWCERLENPRDAAAAQQTSGRRQAQFCRVIASARRSHATWLRQIAGALDEAALRMAAAWARSCDHVAELLHEFEAGLSPHTHLGTVEGRSRLAAAVREIVQTESQMVARLATFREACKTP